MSHPTTPARPATRRRLHRSSGIYKVLSPLPSVHYPPDVMPLQSADITGRLQALADGVAVLEGNMGELARIHHAMNTRFNEPFASFLYGLWITMFCNNFPGCPTKELYENAQSEPVAPLRVELLQQRLRRARLENKRLQDEVASKKAEQETQRSELFGHRPTLAAARRPPPRQPFSRPPVPTNGRKRKVTVAHDDTFSTTDSFVDVPPRVPPSRIALPVTDTKNTSGVGPNLDQPPRYMRGLFDKSASTNTRRVPGPKPATRTPAQREAARANRLASRPPFR